MNRPSNDGHKLRSGQGTIQSDHAIRQIRSVLSSRRPFRIAVTTRINRLSLVKIVRDNFGRFANSHTNIKGQFRTRTFITLGGAAETSYDLRFTLLGIPVRVHPLFWLMGAFLTWNGADFRYTFVGVLCVFISILVHELGHALVSKIFGWHPTIVLYLMGGYATVRQYSPWKNIAVLIAGPFAGLSLFALVFFGIDGYAVRVAGWDPGLVGGWAIGHLLFINLVWSLFNLAPIYPMDGGRILREIITLVRPQDAVRYSLISSMVFSGIVIGFAAIAIQKGTGLFGVLEPKFAAILFALMAVQNYQEYEARFSRRY